MSYLADYRHSEPVRRALAALVPVVCPPEATELGLTDDIVAHTELTLRAFDRGARLAFLAGLAGYELGAAAWPSHPGRLASQLALPRRRRYFERWWQSPLAPFRELAKGVKGMLCLACYEHDAIKERLGYTPEAWIAEVRARRLSVYRDDIERHRAQVIAPDPLPGIAGKARAGEAS